MGLCRSRPVFLVDADSVSSEDKVDFPPQYAAVVITPSADQPKLLLAGQYDGPPTYLPPAPLCTCQRRGRCTLPVCYLQDTECRGWRLNATCCGDAIPRYPACRCGTEYMLHIVKLRGQLLGAAICDMCITSIDHEL